jgi:HEAT repeat protein
MSNYTLSKELRRLYKAAQEEHQRIAVLQALGRLGVWGTLGLKEALQDEYPRVRAEAARLLGDIPDWTPTYSLLQMLLNDDAPTCRASAAEALGKLYAPRLPHERPLGHDDSWAQYFQKEVPAQLIRALLEDESWRVRAAAARALGYLQDKENAKHLARALRDEAHEVRAASVEALGSLRVYPYIGEAKRLLHDPNPAVREAAERAVKMLESY